MPTLTPVFRSLSHPARVLAALALSVALAGGCADGGADESHPASDATSSSAPDAAAALVEVGLAQMETGAEAAAKVTFDNVLALDPANLYAHYNLGLIAQRRGEEAAALRAYDQALEADPDFGPALYNKGILTEGSDLDAAVELYRRAVEADPNFAPAFMRLGFALIHLGRRDEGATYLEKGVGLDPSMANVQAPSYG